MAHFAEGFEVTMTLDEFDAYDLERQNDPEKRVCHVEDCREPYIIDVGELFCRICGTKKID